jgi:hypothetical protein
MSIFAQSFDRNKNAAPRLSGAQFRSAIGAPLPHARNFRGNCFARCSAAN